VLYKRRLVLDRHITRFAIVWQSLFAGILETGRLLAESKEALPPQGYRSGEEL